MAKYRKKPIVIEAFRMGIDTWPDWFTDQISKNKITIHRVGEIGQKVSSLDHSKIKCKIKTLEGEMKGAYGDYIIKGIKGEVYPCKPDIFEQTYNLVSKEN